MSAEAMQKIVREFQNTYGPMTMMWSDRNQEHLSLALIYEAESDERITVGEGKIIEDLKQELGMMSPASDLLQGAQQTWLGGACGLKTPSCTRSRTYHIARRFLVPRAANP